LQKEEQELAASELTNHKELIKEEKKRRAEKEKRKKEQLKAYHSQKEQDRLKELAEHNERIDIMRQEIEEQRKKDKERVDHRHNLYHLKLQEKEMENDQIIQRELEKEARLENLRKSVRIEATHDPDRLISQTQSSKAHSINTTYSEDIPLQQPLFNIHSYTDDTVCSDKRFKVANALQKAGLLSTDYARYVLATIPPPTLPRPDQHSSLFKQN
jgi:hypothetical protein